MSEERLSAAYEQVAVEVGKLVTLFQESQENQQSFLTEAYRLLQAQAREVEDIRERAFTTEQLMHKLEEILAKLAALAEWVKITPTGISIQNPPSSSDMMPMPAQDGAAQAQTGTQQPGMQQPGMQQPGMQQPGMQQPGMQQPGMQQPGMQQPGMQQPGMQQPGMQQPGMQQPGMQQPGMQQPGMQQPGMQQPGMQQPGMQQPGMQQPGMQQPGMQQPGMQQPGMQQPGMQLPGMQQPGMQLPGLQLPGMLQPGMLQPGMQQPMMPVPTSELPENMPEAIPVVKPATGQSHVRFLHASPDAPAIDVYVDGKKVATNLKYEHLSHPLTVDSGRHRVQVFPHGKQSGAVIDTSANFRAGAHYTVAAAGRLREIRPIVVEDAPMGAKPGFARVKVVQLSPNAPALDVTLPTGKVLIGHLTYKEKSPYLQVAPGTRDLELRLAGKQDVVQKLRQLHFEPNHTYTLYVVGLADGEPGLVPLLVPEGR